MTEAAETLKNQALAALRAGDPAAARALADQAVAAAPDMPEAWACKGTVLLVQGDAAGAVQALERAVALRPVFPPGLQNLTMAKAVAGDLDGAVETFRQLVAMAPGLDARGTAQRLLAACIQAQAATPGFTGVSRLVALRLACADLDGARKDLEAWLAAHPDDGPAWQAMIDVHHLGGRIAEAAEAASRAAALLPDDPAPLLAEVALRKEAGDRAAAERLARQALARFPGRAMPLSVMADLDRDAGRADEGGRHLLAAARAADATSREVARACHMAFAGSWWDVLDELAPRLFGLLPDTPIDPYNLLRLPCPAATQRANAEAYCRAAHPARAPLAPPAAAKPRLRLGYLSPDFRSHPVGHTIVDLLERHDRDRFEVVGYDIGEDDNSPIRARIKAATDRFVTLDRSDHAAARAIRDDGCDILIDLAGHTRGKRLGILAYRPAPVQMHFVGYPGTTGASFIDYIVGDPWTIPPEAEGFFTERIIRMPNTYLISSRRAEPAAAPSRAQAGLPESGVVFCSFNSPHKVTRDVFDAWCDILRAVPGSVLWLRIDDEPTLPNLRDAARARGIDPARLIEAKRVGGMAEHLARFHLADLMLDTFPWGAHSTAADALWVGCPLVTVTNETFVSRVCAGLLATAGITETIAADLDDYRRKAIALARDPEARAALRARAAAARHGPLFDPDAFARPFERALTMAWERACAGLPPATIDLAHSVG